jgi:hypothetical protein
MSHLTIFPEKQNSPSPFIYLRTVSLFLLCSSAHFRSCIVTSARCSVALLRLGGWRKSGGRKKATPPKHGERTFLTR